MKWYDDEVRLIDKYKEVGRSSDYIHERRGSQRWSISRWHKLSLRHNEVYSVDFLVIVILISDIFFLRGGEGEERGRGRFNRTSKVQHWPLEYVLEERGQDTSIYKCPAIRTLVNLMEELMTCQSTLFQKPSQFIYSIYTLRGPGSLSLLMYVLSWFCTQIQLSLRSCLGSWNKIFSD